MTVADLIAELQGQPPHVQVRVMTSSIWSAEDNGVFEIVLDETDATEADDVRHCGAYVLIRGR